MEKNIPLLPGLQPLLELPTGLNSLSTKIDPASLLMESKYARMSAPAVVISRGSPIYSSISFDTADNMGRIWTGARVPLAAVARVPLSAAEPVAYGSGVAVRADGLVLAARHTVREVRDGDIWVKLFNQPGGSFKAGILAEDKAEDLVLLKPMSPLGRTVPHLPVTNFADPSRLWKGTDLVSVGVQNQAITTAGNFTNAELFMSPGKFLDKATMHFAGEPSVQRLRAAMAGEYGMSGAATYEVSSGKFVGSVLGGADNAWTGLAPADKIRSMIIRNLSR